MTLRKFVSMIAAVSLVAAVGCGGGKDVPDYGDDDDDYIRNDDYAGRDCSDATQITRLPDGTEIRRTVDACRDAYYGGWKVRD